MSHKDLVPLQAAVDNGDPICMWAMMTPVRSIELKSKAPASRRSANPG